MLLKFTLKINKQEKSYSLFNNIKSIFNFNLTQFPGANRVEMIKKTEKTLRSFNELGEKHLVAIDALKIYNDDTAEEQKTR